MRNFNAPTKPKRSPHAAMRRADAERADGIPDREPYSDARQPIDLDLSMHGGQRWRIEPRLGYASCRLIDEAGTVELVGTMKQILRHLSRITVHTMSPRSL